MDVKRDLGPDLIPSTIRHMKHPTKDGLLTLAGDEDCEIPDLTARFVLEAAEIEDTHLPYGH